MKKKDTFKRLLEAPMQDFLLQIQRIMREKIRRVFFVVEHFVDPLSMRFAHRI